MDNRDELAFDKWIQDHLGMCGTCKYKVKGFCENNWSYEFTDEVEDTDTCGEWVERNHAQALSEARKRMFEKIKRSNRNVTDNSNTAWTD